MSPLFVSPLGVSPLGLSPLGVSVVMLHYFLTFQPDAGSAVISVLTVYSKILIL